MSDPPGADCPECGKAAERVLSGGAGLLFKGEGFYITDYRSDSYKKAAEKDKSSGSKESSKGESKGSGEKSSGSSGSSGSKKGGE